jgi:hypothetical protein
LIVHGPEGLSVRRWAADTQLNGAPFDDAPLAGGDCLALGGVELELVEPQREIAPVTGLPAATSVGNELGESVTSTTENCAELIAAVQESFDAISALEDVTSSGECDALGEADSASSAVASEYEDAAHQFGNAFVEPSCLLLGVAEPEADTADEDSSAVAGSNETAECVEVSDGVKDAGIDATDGATAAEVVFQELQSACAMLRGRVRKVLAALRSQRDHNCELLQQLTEAGEQLAVLTRQRTEWEQATKVQDLAQSEWRTQVDDLRQQLADLESRLAEHTQRMAELQVAIEGARLSASPASLPKTDWRNSAAESISHEREVVAHAGAKVEPKLAEPLWTESTPDSGESLAGDFESPHRPEWSAEAPTPISDSSTTSALKQLNVESDRWESESHSPEAETAAPFSAEVEMPREKSWGEFLPAAKSVANAIGDDVFGPAPAVGQAQADRATWAGNEPVAAKDELSDESSPFAEFSIWKQRAAADELTGVESASIVDSSNVEEPSARGSRTFDQESREKDFSAPAVEFEPASELPPNPWAAAAAERPAEPVETPTPKQAPASFIDRYSHLFAEEVISEPPLAAIPPRPIANEPAKSNGIASEPIGKQVGGVKMGAADEEDSIEQYMAKLLQRVRGDGPQVAASQGSPSTTLAPNEVAKEDVASHGPAIAPAPYDVAQQVVVAAQEKAEAAQAMVDWEAIALRAAAAVPTTDMGALRALANESARSAIGRHELKKQRRDTVTKVIVSLLAGVTSLWLMLNSPNWLDIQFITACVSLVVAAYWAGEALRAMLRSLRAAAYDGPEAHDSEVHGLPIDVA